MWNIAREARLKEIGAELETLFVNKSSSGFSDSEHARMTSLSEEAERLVVEKATSKAALGLAGSASPNESGDPYGGAPGPDLAFKGFAPGMENRVRPPSMFDMDRTQVKALQQAAQQRQSYRVQVGSKGLEHGHFGGYETRMKSAITEGGLTPNLLPAIQQPGQRGFYGIPYELTRVVNYLPTIAFQAASIDYFRHDSNGAEAAYTAEGATKPDLTPVVTEQNVKPAKVAGRINLTHELVQDAGDEFSTRLVTDLARSVYNAESNLLLNGTTGANGFNGINQVSGTLTQAIGSDTALDCLNKSFVALRNDFFEPDLVFVHPSTMGALRRVKDLQDRYLLDLMAGPRGINQTTETENLWGVTVVQTTQQSAGTAAVLSVQSGAAVVYLREALTTFFDPYSQAASNIYQFISEERLCIATPRPGAICLVSGLPTS